MIEGGLVNKVVKYDHLSGHVRSVFYVFNLEHELSLTVAQLHETLCYNCPC